MISAEVLEKAQAALAEANMVARKAFKHEVRRLEREWRASPDYEGSLDKFIAYHDVDYGDAYCFAGWAAQEVFKRHGFDCSYDTCDIYWDHDQIEFDIFGSSHDYPTARVRREG